MIAPRLRLASVLVAMAFALAWQAAAFGAQAPPPTAQRPPGESIGYKPGTGVDPPFLKKEVKPSYTKKAMEAKIQGSLWLECVVTPKGVCTDIKVVRSLDAVHGLDEQAIKALRKWRFIPGKKQGQPVPVLVTIEMNFKLK